MDAGLLAQCVKRRSVRYFSAKKRESWLKWFSDGLFGSYVYDFNIFYFNEGCRMMVFADKETATFGRRCRLGTSE